MAREKICGIYCIENLVNGKRYVGKASNIYDRWTDHRYELKKGNHINRYLQREYNKYGLQSFKFYVIELSDKDNYSEREKYYIKFYETRNPLKGYNFTDGGEGAPGLIVSEERKKFLSETMKGEGNPNFGNHYSIETRKLMSDAAKGRTPMLGKKQTEEAKQKVSKANKGRKVSEQGRKNISEGHKGIVISEEAKASRSRSALGKRRGNKNCTSIYVGVSYRKIIKKWGARVGFRGGKSVWIGVYSTEIEAAISRDKYIVVNKLDRPLNFPEDYPDRIIE